MMRSPRYALVLIASISLAPAALAESFDCRGPLNQIQATICENPALSRADDDLAEVYRRALAADLMPQQLQAEQLYWLSTREAYSNDPVRLLQAYKKRISELRNEADSWRRAGRPLTEVQAAERDLIGQRSEEAIPWRSGRASTCSGPAS